MAHALALLCGRSISVHDFQRDAFVRRRLLLPDDARVVRTFALDDGAVAADLLGRFDGLLQRPPWSRSSWLRHILGDAFDAHGDPRGFFTFPSTTIRGTSYEGVISANTEGVWIEKQPALQDPKIAEFERIKEAYGRLDDVARRRLLGIFDKE